jgi:hypothetical protein
LQPKIVPDGGEANRRRLTFSALPIFVGFHGLATSFSRAKRDEIGCEPRYEPSKGNCGGDCMNRSVSRDNGWPRWYEATLRTMRSRPTSEAYVLFGIRSPTCGDARFGAVVNGTERPGPESPNWWLSSYPPLESPILGRMTALSSTTRGGSPVRELRSPGFGRGALSNERPYRDR